MTADGLPARKAALALLSGVLTRRKPLDADLPQLKALPPRDAAFARALASQTLRHLGALEATLRKFLAKPLSPANLERFAVSWSEKLAQRNRAA